MIMLFEDCATEMFKSVEEIRYIVFLQEQHAQGEALLDEYDALDTTRFALSVDPESRMPYAAGRIIQYKDGVKIGRIAVLPEKRGTGEGKKLVEFMCRSAEDKGIKKIYVDAQLHAVPFYDKLGFKPTGEETIFDIGIEHLPMVKE